VVDLILDLHDDGKVARAYRKYVEARGANWSPSFGRASSIWRRR
jgi:hypothetical protein